MLFEISLTTGRAAAGAWGVVLRLSPTCIVTGDKVLLYLEKYGNIDIISLPSLWKGVGRKANESKVTILFFVFCR